MESQRAKRAIKPPKKYSEDEEERPARDTPEAEQPIFVYRLLKKKEVNKDLVHQEVYVLWPDNGIWYKAEVTKLHAKVMKAELEYPKEGEREEADLTELIKDGHIALMEPRVPNHRLRKDEFMVPEDTDTPLISEPVLEMSEDDRTSPEREEEEGGHRAEQEEEEEDDDDIPDAGAIEEEPSEASEASEAAASEQASSSSSGDDAMVAEEEAGDLSAPAEEEDEEELMEESMDEGEAEGGLPSLGKRRSTDTALSAQTGSKRPRPGSLAEVARKQGWRPQTSSVNRGPLAPSSPKPSTPAVRSPTHAQPLRSPTRSSAQQAAAATALAPSHGSEALQSAEAAAARASQIAEAAMTAGAAAEEAAADAEDYETASKYAQQLLGSLGKAKPSGTAGKRFYGATQLGDSGGVRASGYHQSAGNRAKQDPQAVRDKVVSNLASSLEKAASELKKEGHSQGLPDATAVARAVEQALQKHFGMDKEYRQKVRSLSYNLSDASNPELRARVLQGEVTPDRLVQMTPNELASKELSQWRQQQLQESLRNSVLDEEAAAKFSTAAALAAKEKRSQMAKANYDKGLLTAIDQDEKAREATPPVRDSSAEDFKPSLRHLDSISSAALKPPEVSSPSHPLSPTGDTPHGDFSEAQAPFQGGKGEEEEAKPLGSRSSGGGGSGGSSSFNWATIKAHASKLAKDAEAPDNRFKGFDEFMASAKARAAAKTQAQAPADTETAKTEAEDQPYSPSAGVMVEDDPDLPDLVSLIGSSGVTGQKEVWRGKLHVPGMFRAHVVIDTVAGTGDIGRMFTSSEVEVKGRVNLDKLTAFLEELRVSRSRTVSLGTLSCARAASAADHTHIVELINMYSSKQRTGVLDLEAGLEAYIIPPCALVDRLLKTAKKSATLATHTAASIPDTIEDVQLLLVVIHRKDWKPSVPKAEPMHNPADTPDAHAESSQPSPHDLPAVGIQNPSDAVSGLLSVPGPPQDPPSAPEHNIPLLQGPDPVDTLPSAPPAQGQLAAGNQQSSMQQLQAALSAQAQGNVLPAGLDLGSISALAAALGVQSVAMPGSQGGPTASASGLPPPSSSGPHIGSALPSSPGPIYPGRAPQDPSRDPRMGHPGQGDLQHQWQAPQWAPNQAPGPGSGVGPGLGLGHHPAGPDLIQAQEGYGPPEYPPAHPDLYQQPHQAPPSYAPHLAGNARLGMPMPQPMTLQAPQGGGYPLQPGQGQIQRPMYHHGPSPGQGPARNSYPGPSAGPLAPGPVPIPAHRREGLVGWEGLDSVIGGSRRGRDSGRGRGGPGRGREGRGRHSGGRGGEPGPASGGRFDHDSLEFDQQGAPGSMDGRGGGREGEGSYLPPPPRGRGVRGRGRADMQYDNGRGFSDRGRGGGRGSGEFGRGIVEFGRGSRGRGPARGRMN
ncbi:hypothetical protein ABBQ38_014510 [Trebouxia sp. C0009 RCD-2024]